MKRIAILGSTGSIGRSTLSVAETYPDRFQIVALAAGRNLEAALEQARRWHPRVISMAAEKDADTLCARLKKESLSDIEVVHGSTGTVRVATDPEIDFVVSAIVGVAGTLGIVTAWRSAVGSPSSGNGMASMRRGSSHVTLTPFSSGSGL